MTNNSAFPLNLTRSSVMQRRTGANWKMFNTNTSNNFVIKQSVPSNRPPAHNNSHGEKNNELKISGGDANQFRARPLKQWRKQRSINPEAKNNSNTNSINLAYNYDVPGGTNNTKFTLDMCDKDPNNHCESTKTIANWQTSVKTNKNDVGRIKNLNGPLCSPNIPTLPNINGVPSNVYLQYTSIPVCDAPTKALNLVRSSSLINKATNKLNNQKFYQSHAAYLKHKNKTYNRNLSIKGNKDANVSSLYQQNVTNFGMFQNPYNANKPATGTCNDCNIVVKNYNNINNGIVKRKMWGSMDASSRIQERKMAAINLAAANSNKKQSDGNVPFPDQGNAMANALKYSGRVGPPQTLKTKYYSPKQCQVEINRYRRTGRFTTPCKVPCPTAANPNAKCHIYADRPYRQSNTLIKTPITPQMTVQEIANKYNKTTREVLTKT